MQQFARWPSQYHYNNKNTAKYQVNNCTKRKPVYSYAKTIRVTNNAQGNALFLIVANQVTSIKRKPRLLS